MSETMGKRIFHYLLHQGEGGAVENEIATLPVKLDIRHLPLLIQRYQQNNSIFLLSSPGCQRIGTILVLLNSAEKFPEIGFSRRRPGTRRRGRSGSCST